MIKDFFPDIEFKAFLFDFDGTVADTMPLHQKAWDEALSVYNLTLTVDQHREWAGMPTRAIIERLSELHKIKLSADEILKNKSTHYLNGIASVTEVIPVVDIIREYHGKIPMAIVSGSRRQPILSTMEHLKLKKYFDVIVAAEDYLMGKPAPDCFLQAAKALNVNPKECLVFEDGILGIEAAHAAGMECLRVIEDFNHGHNLVSVLKL